MSDGITENDIELAERIVSKIRLDRLDKLHWIIAKEIADARKEAKDDNQ